MSRWVEIVNLHRKKLGLDVWDDIPDSSFHDLAQQCGPDEILEMKQRLAELDKEELEIPEWDGDSMDQVRKARALLRAVLEIKSGS